MPTTKQIEFNEAVVDVIDEIIAALPDDTSLYAINEAMMLLRKALPAGEDSSNVG